MRGQGVFLSAGLSVSHTRWRRWSDDFQAGSMQFLPTQQLLNFEIG